MDSVTLERKELTRQLDGIMAQPKISKEEMKRADVILKGIKT